MGQYNIKITISGGLFSTTGPDGRKYPEDHPDPEKRGMGIPRPEGIVSEKLFSGPDRRVIDGPGGAIAFLSAQKAFVEPAPEDGKDQPAAVERGEQPDKSKHKPK